MSSDFWVIKSIIVPLKIQIVKDIIMSLLGIGIASGITFGPENSR
jgi:hypothetical protein